jgi:alpha-beta hydrolase superfamily lysophospholipase
MEFIYKDHQYSFQSLRAIGAAYGGAADVGECLKTIYRIKEGDDEGWHRGWLKTAEEREKQGDAFLSKGQKVSAGAEYLRASNYYRTAEFFLHGNPGDPRILSTWRRSRDTFLKAAALFDKPVVTPVEIPYEGKSLPGYFCLADNTGEKRPLIIIHTGFDGTMEELYYQNAYAALKRGYNCLLFEGPGQGRAVREQGLKFRPDWEKVVTPVVDFALKRKEVDPEKVILMGISFGGYLAPRAVAFEKRIRACIANGGVYTFDRVDRETAKYLATKEGRKGIDEEIYSRMKKDPSLRWAMNNGMFTFGAKSPSEWLVMTRAYTLKDVVDRIECPMLVVDSEKEKDLPGQSKLLYNALKSPKTFMMFTEEEGAEEHCQMGASAISSARILGWLDELLK